MTNLSIIYQLGEATYTRVKAEKVLCPSIKQENKRNHQDLERDLALSVYCKPQGEKQTGGDKQHDRAPAF